jgi:Tfp pilus assembly protein PilF
LEKQANRRTRLRFYDRAVAVDPNNADVRTNLGLLLAREGRFSEAAAQLKKYCVSRRNSAEAHSNLGVFS